MNNQSNSTALPVVSIGGTEIQPLAYKGVRVITSELLAKEFGTSSENLASNLSRNKSRFEEGVHFYRVAGYDLRALKNSIAFSNVVGANANQLMLWTERGVFRHAKILETDQAWEAYEHLEDVYFSVREVAPSMPMTPAEIVLQNAQALVAFERRQAKQQAEIDAVRSDVAEIKQAHTVLPKMPADCEGIERIRDRMNKRYKLSVPVVDKIMRDSPLAPTIRVLVRNPHAEGVHNAGFSRKEVSAIFKRFVNECVHSAGKLYTHQYVHGRFQLVKGGDE